MTNRNVKPGQRITMEEAAAVQRFRSTRGGQWRPDMEEAVTLGFWAGVSPEDMALLKSARAKFTWDQWQQFRIV